jgi:alkylated DNA repair dioxygenase AlkB
MLALAGGRIDIHDHPYLGWEPDYLFALLQEHMPWEQRSVVIYGKEIPQPRLVAWFGDYGYMYSGLMLPPRPFPFILEQVRDAVSRLTGTSFNGVLLNYYRDGRDSIGMHADDEPEFGFNPTIASLSLGAERRMDFQRKDKSSAVINIPLTHGSVLVMSGETQTYWKHGITKTSLPVGPRINLTFRNIVNPR